MSEEQQYDGEDDALEVLGNLRDITAPRAMVNVEKTKREVMQCTGIELTDEPKGQGNDSDNKGVFYRVSFEVMTGGNQGYEWSESWWADTRIKKGKQKSAFKSVAMPKMKGLAMAVKGAQHQDSFWQGCVQSQATQLKDVEMRAQGLCGQRFIAELGVERGSAIVGAPGQFYADKQAIKGFVPAQS